MSAIATSRLQGEIESPRPLQAPGGNVTVSGWCLLEGQPEAPPVRLRTPAGQLTATHRLDRTDVALKWAGEPAAARCGFRITGRLPPGVYLALFEAQLPDQSWHVFKSLSIVAGRCPVIAGVDSPAKSGQITRRTHVEGWAFHPGPSIQALAIRYGHQEIACRLGGTRPDLPILYPDALGVSDSGFKSELILSAGCGPLRLKARLADNSVVLVRTDLEIAIRTDENIGPEINLTGKRTALPGDRRRVSTAPIHKTPKPQNLLFILPGSFASNSALHVAALADQLAATGHSCAVAVPEDLETLVRHEHPRFRGLTFADAATRVVFPNGRGPDLVHAWTTRENVRKLAVKVIEACRAKLVVHLEDNELALLAGSLGCSLDELRALPSAELDRLVPATLSHPHRSREFLAAASGVTLIAGRLSEFVPANCPSHLLAAAADARYFFPRPQPRDFREILDPAPDTTVLFYHGNVHAANAREVRELYAAVLQLNREGQSVTLLRTGLDQVDFLGSMAAEVAPFILALGQIPHHRHLPPLLALADIFVQPGESDAFNDYRFPSKLPEFFSLGRPVVLPRTNLGACLRHGIDAYVLDRADASGIASAVRELRRDRGMYERLSAGAVAYAARTFSWERSAEALARFYEALAA